MHQSVFAIIGAGILLSQITLQAQSPFAGSYNGVVYTSITGTVTVPESPIGVALLNVDNNGVVSQSGGGLTGQVDGSGNITWQTPNPLHVATGVITSGTGVLSSMGSVDNNGAVTHFRIAANNAAGSFGSGGTFASALQWCNPSPTDSALNAITCGAGIFLAVGEGGAVVWSSDGVDWSSSYSGTGRDLNDVAFGAGVFVAVGDGGTIISSVDGINWSPRSSTAFQNYTSIAYGNNTFVAGVLQNGFQVSADGVSWSAAAGGIGSLESVAKIEFGNGQFVAVVDPLGATTFKLQTSTDGSSWNSPVTLPAESYNNLTYAASKWVIVTDRATYTFTSADGSGFVNHAQAFVLESIAHDGSKFIAGTSGKEVKQSADGVNWTTLAFVLDDINPRDSIHGKGVTVLVGEHGILTTSDGTNFDQRKKDGRTARIKQLTHVPNGDFYALAGGSRVYPALNSLTTGLQTGNDIFDMAQHMATSFHILVGQDGIIAKVNLNGSVSATQSYPVSPTTENLYGVGATALLANRALAAVGEHGTIITSPDNTVWTQQTSPTSETLRDCEGGGAVFVAVGDNGVIVTATDSDLTTWTLRTSGTTQRLNRVYYNDTASQFVVVGNNGTILASSDGTSWTARTSGAMGNLTGVARGRLAGGDYFAVSDRGEIVKSDDEGATWMDAGISLPEPGAGVAADPFANTILISGRDRTYYETTDLGVTWTLKQILLPSPAAIDSVAFGRGRYVGVGGSQSMVIDESGDTRIYLQTRGFHDVTYAQGMFVAAASHSGNESGLSISTDGISWSTVTAPHISPFRGIHYANGMFVAVGDTGRIISSPDARNWTSRASDISAQLNSVVYGNGVWVAAGTVGFVRRSADGITWTDDSVGSNFEVRDLHFANGLFVAVGNGGRIRTSPDGDTWTNRTSGLFDTLHSVAYLGGTWVAVGEVDSGAAVIATSLDGMIWTAESSNVSRHLKGIFGANGQAIVTGDNAIVLKANYPDTTSPVITGQPMGQSFANGATINLSVTVAGAGPFHFQWFRNGVPLANSSRISGATSAALTITGAIAEDGGTYWVSVDNASGGRQSTRVSLAGPPVISQHPQSTTQNPTSGATFTVQASGTGPFTYGWRKNGMPLSDTGNISGSATASLDVSAITSSDAGVYTVDVSNASGTSTSQSAGLNVSLAAAGAVSLTLDTAFNANVPTLSDVSEQITSTFQLTSSQINSIAVQADGKVLVAGLFSYLNGASQTRNSIIRLNTDGTLDTTFDPPVITGLNSRGFSNPPRINGVTVGSAGEILLAGNQTHYGGVVGNASVTLLNPANGAVNTSFAVPTFGAIGSHAEFDSMGRVVVGFYGSFSAGGGNYKMLARLLANGTFDPSFNTASTPFPPDPVGTARFMFVNSNDDVILNTYSDNNYANVSPYRVKGSDGSQDTGFTAHTMPDTYIDGIRKLATGDGFLIFDFFKSVDGQHRWGLAEFDGNGVLQPTYATFGVSTVVSDNRQFRDALDLPGGNVLLGGNFDMLNDDTVNRLVLVDSTGQLVPSMAIGTGPNGNITTIGSTADRSQVFVAGQFSTFNGQPAAKIVKFNTSSSGGSMLTAPEIRGITSDVTTHAGANVTLNVAALGTGTLQFQWRKGDMDIPGATSLSLQLPNIQTMQAGSYSVRVTDDRGTITSSEIAVTVDGMGGGGQNFTAWQTGINWMGADQSPNGNPDMDPFPNFLEFIFGLDPLAADTEADRQPRAVLVNVGGMNYPAIRFRRHRTRAGFRIDVDARNSLTSQTVEMTTEESPTDLGNDVDEATIRGQQAIENLSQLIFRIKLIDTNTPAP